MWIVSRPIRHGYAVALTMVEAARGIHMRADLTGSVAGVGGDPAEAVHALARQLHAIAVDLVEQLEGAAALERRIRAKRRKRSR